MFVETWARAILNVLVVFLLLSFFCASVVAQVKREGTRKADAAKRLEQLEDNLRNISERLDKLVGTDDPRRIAETREEQTRILSEVKSELELFEKSNWEQEEENRERDERLDALASEIDSIWRRIEELSAKLSREGTFETAGWENGFFLSSRDGRHKLVLTGFVKPYYSFTVAKVYETDSYGGLVYDSSGDAVGGDLKVIENGFGLANMRFGVDARVFEIVRFGLEIDWGNLYGQVVFPTNASVPTDAEAGIVEIDTYSLRALAAFGEFAPRNELKIRGGQFKVPFDRETLVPVNQLTFSSPSLMTKRYPRWGEWGIPEDSPNWGWDYEYQRGSSFGYDRGFMVHGEALKERMNYACGVFNGNGPNASNDNRDILVAVRLSYDPLGPVGLSTSDREITEKPIFSVGGGFAFDLPKHKYAEDSSRTYNSQDINATVDAMGKWQGFALMAAVYYRHSDHGAVAGTIDTLGYVGQLAYYFENLKIEPAFRYSLMDANVNRSQDHVHELTAAINYYVLSDNLKIGLEWQALLAANSLRSYMAPWEAWFSNRNQFTIVAQAGF